MDELRRLRERGQELWENVSENESISYFQGQVSATVRELARATRSEGARMKAAAIEQLHEVKTAGEKLLQEAGKYEAIFFDTLKKGVFVAAEHERESLVVAGTLVILALPASRNFLYKRTLGRFRTPEGLLQTAEQRLENLKQSLDVVKNDSSKLQERAQMAEQEFLSGRSKLRATAAEVKRSWEIAQREELKAAGLKELLKELPARDSVRLRSELTAVRHDLSQQARILDRQAFRISRLGIDV